MNDNIFTSVTASASSVVAMNMGLITVQNTYEALFYAFVGGVAGYFAKKAGEFLLRTIKNIRKR